MLRKRLEQFSRDERGNFALTFAVGTTVILGVIGASMDYSMASRATKRSQQISDAVALSGAVFVKNEGRSPGKQSEGGLPAGTYTAAQLDYDYGDFVVGGANGVEVIVAYDDDAKEVNVKVVGKTETTFTRVLGQKTVDFSSESTVSYMEIEDAQPASIALVLDNSGSMDFDDMHAENVRLQPGSSWKRIGDSPTDAESRIGGLRRVVTDFSSDLETRLATNKNSERRILRMGMLPYSADTLVDRTVPMDWGYLDSAEISQMDPNGATNSNPPMAQALSWMKREDDIHSAEAAANNVTDKEPLKFVVLMSDGENTIGNWTWEPNNKANTYYELNSYYVSEIVKTVVFADEYDASKHPNHQRGYLRRDSDKKTLKSCQKMRDDENVEIFTIGFALEEGYYHTGDWARWDDEVYKLDAWKASNAQAMLAGCASKAENFMLANDVSELNDAFNRIQNAIVEELIRIKS